MTRNPDNIFRELFEPLTKVGVDAPDMLNLVNHIVSSEKGILCQEVIISGGIKSFLDGYYFIKKCKIPAVYGQASSFLKHAQGDYSELQQYIRNQVRGLEMAYAYLQIRE